MPLLLALALLLVLPAAAPAATATLATHRESLDSHNPPSTAATVTIAGAPGEANRLRITSLEHGVEAVDEGAPLEPGPGCTAVDAQRVRCADPAAGRVTVRVAAGDGDDAVAISSLGQHELSAEVSGEDGADSLDLSGMEATGFANRLGGGAGDDRVVGSPGSDTFTLGAGTDALDGGPGDDGLINADPTSIAADLGAGTAARVDGRSTLLAIETVAGTPSADRLVGGPGPDELHGGGGEDFLDGGGGDDWLEADDPIPDPFALGRDVLIGGDGDDRLGARGGGDRLDAGPGDDVVSPGYTGLKSVRDRASCGPGRDRVHLVGPAALLRDCEQIGLGGAGYDQPVFPRPALAGAGWSVAFDLKCDDSFGIERCPTRITLREAKPPGHRLGTVIARRRLVVMPRDDGRAVRVRVYLGRRGRAVLRQRGGRLHVLVHLRMPFDADSFEDSYATVLIGA